MALLKIVNPIFFVVILFQLTSGILRSTMLHPPYQIAVIHAWSGYLTALILCVHLFLNSGWIKANFFSKKK